MTIYTTEHSALTEEKKDLENGTDNEVEIFLDENLLSNLKDDECNLVYKDPVIPIRKPKPTRRGSCKATCQHLCVLFGVLLSVAGFSITAVYIYRSYYPTNWYWCQVMLPSNVTSYYDYNYDDGTDPVYMSEWIRVGDDVEDMNVHKTGDIVPRASIRHDCHANQTAIKDDNTNRCFVTESHQYVVQPRTLQSLMDGMSTGELISPSDMITLNYTITNASLIELSATIIEHCDSAEIYQLTPGFVQTSTSISYVQFTGEQLLRYEVYGMIEYNLESGYQYYDYVPEAAERVPVPQP